MKYIEDLEFFKEKIKKIEKILFITNFFTSKKMLLEGLEEAAYAARMLLIAILKYAHSQGEIELSNESKNNKNLLQNIIASKWDMAEDVDKALTIINLNKQHKKSTMEFMKNKKVVILDEKNNMEIMTTTKLKIALIAIKSIQNTFKGHLQANKDNLNS